jgi:HK97 family phage major capsid protein
MENEIKKEFKTTEELIDAINNKFAEYNGLMETVKTQGETLTKLKTIGYSVGGKRTRKELIEKSLMENKIRDLKQGQEVQFEVKDVANVSSASMVAGLNEVALPFRETEIDKAPRNMPFIQELIQWGAVNGNTVDWLEQTTKTDASDMRAEDAVIAQGELAYTERSTKVKNLGELIKVTEESLSDYPFLSGEINDELGADLNLLLSNQLLSGDGEGNNLEGFTEKAAAFAPGNFENKVNDASYIDVIRVAIAQIVDAGKGKFIPNYAILNNDDFTKLQLTKDSTGQYLIPAWMTDSGLNISGVRVVTNPAMEADKYLVGDFTKAKGFYKGGLNIKLGWEGTDFKYNRVTVRGTMRVALRVKTQDEPAFVYGNFENDRGVLITG